MGQLLRLISGDKRNPTRSLSIANSSSSSNVHLRSGGFSPGPGPKKVYWSGLSPRQDGQKRLGSIRDNSKQVITYDLNGGSAAELGYLQREITRFFEDARLYEEEYTSVPCWLEYRWHDGLDDAPAPTWGQFSYYIRILDGGPPQWPKTLHNTGVLTSGNVEEVMCELTCQPFWEGLQQNVGTGWKRIDMSKDGLMIGTFVANLITNPSFGHPTWDTGWTSSATGLAVRQETRPGYTRGDGSAAHAYNRAAANRFTQTLTLTAATYIISCYARRPDGAALTSADLQMWGQGAAQTTTFVSEGPSTGSGWYRCYATFTGVAASSTHGIQVKAGREVIFDDVQLALANATFGSNFPVVFSAGHLLGCTWAGTAHASTSNASGGVITWSLTNEFSGEHTLVGWFTPYWETTTASTLFEWKFDTNNLCNVTFATGANFVITLTSIVGGVTVTGTATKSATYPDYSVPIHFAVVRATTTLKLYINGVEEISLAESPASAPLVTFSLGKDVAQTVASINGAFDGWRVWDRAFSATYISTLYTNELEVKSAGGLIGMPPFFWTEDGDNILKNVNDTGRDNWGVLAGVVGDVEALTEWRIQLPTSTPLRITWLGRKATETNFDAALLYHDMSGTVDANSSGGEYETVTTSAVSTAFNRTLAQRLNDLRGRYQWLARIFVSTNSIEIQPVYNLGATGGLTNNYGDLSTLATNATFLFRDLGELGIYWDDRQTVPTTAVVFLSFTPTTGSTTTHCDFFQLLPWPWCRVEALDTSLTIVTGDLLIISDTVAYVNTAANLHKYTFEHRGAAVNVEPGKYNTIYMLQGAEGVAYDITDTGTFTIYITPRWLLPGGAVA